MTHMFNGLGTFPIKVNTAGYINLEGKVTLPNLIEGAIGNSQVVITVNLNGGSAFYTGQIGAEGFKTAVSAAEGDTINVILTSSAAIDQGLNIIKSTISVF